MTVPKKGRQLKICTGERKDPQWLLFMRAAQQRIVKRGGFDVRGAAMLQLAAEIVRHGHGEAFLKAVRRGRPTARQNLRYQLLREVESQIGAGVPRRREDRNTPEAINAALRYVIDHPLLTLDGRIWR